MCGRAALPHCGHPVGRSTHAPIRNGGTGRTACVVRPELERFARTLYNGDMKRPPPRPTFTSRELVFPQPDAEGIAKTQELYLNKVGKTLTEGEAREVLSRVMRYLFLLNFPCSDTESTPENPTTTAP